MDFIFYCEIIGTIIFAIQGSIVAIQKEMDILGITILGLTTAVGGGMIRDVLLGSTPPAMFISPIYCIIAFTTVACVIVLYNWSQKVLKGRHLPYAVRTFQVLDAIGLGIFCVVGTSISIQSGFTDNAFLCCFVGTMTAVGGGILRDLLANRMPVVLQKDIYAVAAIIGSIIYYYMSQSVGDQYATYLTVLIVVTIRLLVIYKDIHLPSVYNKSENT